MSALQAFYAGAFSAGSGTPTLAQVLTTGNVASADINMAQNDITNVAVIQNTVDSITISAPQGIKLADSAGTAGQFVTSNAFAQPTWSTLGGVGTQNQVLTLNSSLAPVWATPAVPPPFNYTDTITGTGGNNVASTFTTLSALPAGNYLFFANFIFLNSSADCRKVTCYLQKPDTTYIAINRVFQTDSGTATTAQQSFTLAFSAVNNATQDIAVQMLVDSTSLALQTCNLFGFTYIKMS